MKIRQITVKQGKQSATVRYNPITHILYTQNRSNDIEISLEDFLDRLKTTRKQAKKNGAEIIEERIEENKKW